ncbi:MAG TPA: response regulator [Gemmataceae bacterium]|jgi:CheY-like chemotaxis protein|nr:response regulator [Gemmataceae bacterium]
MPAETRGRVLVVDDEPDAALTLTTLLSLGGYSARACHDGPTALALAAKLRPTACVLDIMMPGMDGFELARRLRAILGQEVVLVAVTGRSGDEPERLAEAAGFDWFFTKPADPDELLVALAVPADSTDDHTPLRPE